ncbi:MAG: hypothetical protein N3D11_03080 [Candidatus Sumerlaeia bacterium]|nr:hypothetical protein [Candidatus Sumerlaeia bacterium]
MKQMDNVDVEARKRVGVALRRDPASGAGWTLVELLVALAVAMVFLGGVTAAFIQILRISDRSERMSEAYQNARAAVETIAISIKGAAIVASQSAQHFQGVNVPTLAGDRIDNDRDGRIDEEQPNGRDDDGDWARQHNDRHAQIGTGYERAAWAGRADLGDELVDEDCVFHNDQLAFLVFPNRRIPGSRSEIVSFSIGSWEGENHVLLQQRLPSPGSGMPAEIAPLAHNVLGLNFLYWDANSAEPYWTETWDALAGNFPPPGLELPASVYISVTVYAGAVPLEQVGPGQPLEVVTCSTIVNIESVIHDPRYETMVRPAR